MNSKANTDIYGLILSGGKSSRMGRDKSRLIYHSLPQEEHLFQMLSKFLPKVYLSKKTRKEGDYPVIIDNHEIESPLNGILSAFDKHPQVAWLVIGCDMPLIEPGNIKHLLKARDNNKIATCYLSDDGKPHPLFTIFEPRAYPLIKAFSKKNISPRAFLTQQDVKTLDTPNDSLKGANTLEEMKALKHEINSRL